jgi:hypothetical protein
MAFTEDPDDRFGNVVPADTALAASRIVAWTSQQGVWHRPRAHDWYGEVRGPVKERQRARVLQPGHGLRDNRPTASRPR